MRRCNFRVLITLFVVQFLSLVSLGQNKALDTDVDTTAAGIFVPNAFTPDGDGNNDSFKPVTLGTVDRYEISVFDRWGELVWYSKDPAESWDGTYQSNPCKTDRYIYKLTMSYANNDKVESSYGRVAVLR